MFNKFVMESVRDADTSFSFIEDTTGPDRTCCWTSFYVQCVGFREQRLQESLLELNLRTPKGSWANRSFLSDRRVMNPADVTVKVRLEASSIKHDGFFRFISDYAACPLDSDLIHESVPISFRFLRTGGKRLSWGAGGFQSSGSCY